MRLEEWQRFLETQYLDDEPKPVTEPEPIMVPELEIEVPVEPPAVVIELPAVEPPTAAIFSEDFIATHIALKQDALLSLPFDTGHEPEYAVTADTRPPALKRTSETDTPRPSFMPQEEFDVVIPAFADYLPVPKSPPVPKIAPIDAPTTAIIDIPKPRTVKTRARHARNVKPEPAPPAFSADELWAKVPQHLQTLLAMERKEEEEVAQFSYKRPFAEKRLELIERLLDPVLSLEDTARLLNVCPATVRRYTNRGILSCYRKEPENMPGAPKLSDKETRQRRFRLSDILAFLEAQSAVVAADRQKDTQ